MTACKDVQDVNLGKKAVSAALAGTLAVGMVPAVALAAPADDAAADDGIESLALTAVQDVAGGKITAATLNGAAVADLSKITVAISDFVDTDTTNSSPAFKLKDFAVTQITTKSGVVLNLASNNCKVEYNTTGTTYAASLDAAPGAGPLKIQLTLQNLSGAMADYNGAKLEATLNVVGASLSGTVAEVAGKQGDTNFVYNFGNQAFDYYLNGTKLTATDYAAAYFDADGKSVTAPTVAGTYSAVLTGADTYDGSKVTIPLKVQKLDLAKANIALDSTSGSIAVDTVNGVAWASTNNELKTIITGPDGTANNGAIGSYTVTVTPANPNNPNITGSQTISYDITSAAAAFEYNGSSISAGGQWTQATASDPFVYTYTAGVSGDAAFNYELLTAEDASGNKLAVDYTVTDMDGNAATLADLAKVGTWKVTAKVDAKANGYACGGSETVIVTNYAGEVTSADIVVKKDGAVTNSPTFNYTGEDFVKQLDITVKSGDKTLTAGTDYKYEIKNAANTKVEKLVNQGAYTVTVTSDTYEIAGGNTVTVTINAAAVTGIRPAALISVDNGAGGTKDVLAYTGEVIKPTFEYTTAQDPTADDAVWTTLPADQYTVAYTGAGTELKAVGSYNALFTCVSVDGSTNFNFNDPNALSSGAGIGIEVAEIALRFQDVPTTSIYYNVINTAAKNGYMTGYNGTKLFGPNDKITRAQVACVLFKMAGSKATIDQDKYNEQTGYETGFSDVDGHKWYAQAIAWAKNANVISGYGDGTFGPNDMITRQQFATMLANYARAMGQSTTVEDVDAVLATKKDGGQVASWAKDSVAWAVSKQIMGNGGSINPKSDITRAEVAAMAVNFQPEEL